MSNIIILLILTNYIIESIDNTMRMDVKLVSFILMLPIVLLKAEVTLLEDLQIFQKTILNYIFPKDPGIMRVRKPEEVKTVNNVTTLDFIGLVERYGYPAEEHYITTEDGYNLAVHRISGSPLAKGQRRKKVVFLQHALTLTSDSWVLCGPGKDLAFLLADQGYDVWLGNSRGNSYCRSHIKMSPRYKDFWQFSFHEIGTIDLPAMIDYVLKHTEQKTLSYVGHSMGNLLLFTLLSMRPEYNVKIKLGICLGPVAVWKELPPLFKLYSSNDAVKIKEFFDFNEIYEIASLSSTIITLGRTLCADNTITQSVCVAVIFFLCGSDPEQFNATALPEIISQIPGGTSVYTILNLWQNFDAEKLQAYDYGHFGNYKHYGQITPITYDLKKVTAPLALFYGANDILALKSNVLESPKVLPNIIVLEEVPYKLFNHLDFILAVNAKTLLYDRLIELLQEFNN